MPKDITFGDFYHYAVFKPDPTGFDSVAALEAFVSGPNRNNRLYICTGVVLLEFITLDDDWWIRQDGFSFLIPDLPTKASGAKTPPCLTFFEGEVAPEITCAVWLASIGAQENDFGFAVDSSVARWDKATGRIKVRPQLALKGDKGYMMRLGYQVSFLAHIMKKTSPEGCKRQML